jgi:hypothetical protein
MNVPSIACIQSSFQQFAVAAVVVVVVVVYLLATML